MKKQYKYDLSTGVIYKKVINAKKTTLGVLATAGIIGSMAVPALAAGGPTSGPVSGPGCFGKWRAGSVQDINGHAPGTDNAGGVYFSDRAGTNSTINAENRAQCDGL